MGAYRYKLEVNFDKIISLFTSYFFFLELLQRGRYQGDAVRGQHLHNLIAIWNFYYRHFFCCCNFVITSQFLVV